MSVFMARYEGLCPHCGDDIAVGDVIAWSSDHAIPMHEDCADTVLDGMRAPVRQPPVCTQCWLAHAGECP